MVVDDNPDNLTLLGGMLRRRGYSVRSFPNGRLALAAVAENPPDLILLDVGMPEMNGFEVCSRLKAMDEAAGIPVLFISAMQQTVHKVKGFRAGGVDYISKPFQFEEVHARLQTHLALRRAQRAEQELLERTLNGVIGMLSDLVHSASPGLAARSRAIRGYVACITRKLRVPEPWQYDLAATLSLLGCITLPEETFQRVYGRPFTSHEEEAMFRAHPESGARLLANIPRLETSAEMIRLQQAPGADPNASPEAKIGARMLFLATELDRMTYRGTPHAEAITALKIAHGRLDPAMLEALSEYSPEKVDFRQQLLPIRQMFAGMTLDQNVIAEKTGLVIFRKGTVLNQTWLERLMNFKRCHGVKEPIKVRVPGIAAPPVFRLRSKPLDQIKLEETG